MTAHNPPDSVDPADIERAAARLDGIAHRTPVYTSATCNRLAGGEVYFKCENFQRMGAFKIRGAYNAIRRLPESVAGVVAGSSGSHAQAVALAASLLGKKAILVMPRDALAVKVAATRQYGGEIVFFDREKEERATVVRRVSDEYAYPEIPAHDHPDVIAGQGTVALEFHSQVAGLTHLLVPVSGGGLLAGCAVTTRALAGGCAVYGVEPKTGDDFFRSLSAGRITGIPTPNTIADGLKCRTPGTHAFSLAQKYVAGMALVTDDEILDAVEFLWSRMKLVVEPSGAVPLAALLHGRIPNSGGGRIGIVLSGGNADIPAIGALLAARSSQRLAARPSDQDSQRFFSMENRRAS
jgi:threonine dehydratase